MPFPIPDKDSPFNLVVIYDGVNIICVDFADEEATRQIVQIMQKQNRFPN